MVLLRNLLGHHYIGRGRPGPRIDVPQEELLRQIHSSHSCSTHSPTAHTALLRPPMLLRSEQSTAPAISSRTFFPAIVMYHYMGPESPIPLWRLHPNPPSHQAHAGSAQPFPPSSLAPIIADAHHVFEKSPHTVRRLMPQTLRHVHISPPVLRVPCLRYPHLICM